MSITINIYYTGKNDSAKRFAEEMISGGTVSEIRKEAGNLRYEYFLPMDDPETVLLIDVWRDREALELHHKSAMMKKIATLREKYKLKMRVEIYNQQA